MNLEIGILKRLWDQLHVPNSIEFKAIKKDATGKVTWQEGNNHTYLVPSSGTGNVTIDW